VSHRDGVGTFSYVTGRLGVSAVSPVVSCGRYPARAVVGEHLPIAATVFREGHDAVGANVAWRGPDDAGGSGGPFIRMVPGVPGTDRWHATVVPTTEGAWTYSVEAWGDPVATWRHKVEVKIDAGQGPEDLANDLEDGARLLQRALRCGRPTTTWPTGSARRWPPRCASCSPSTRCASC
jgi:starch synthase (maltosyl-transferring)